MAFPRERRTLIADENVTKHYPALLPFLTSALSKTVCYKDLLPVTPAGTQRQTVYRVVNADTLTAAEPLVRAHGAARVAVLNMASHVWPGGGFRTGAGAQEEALCRRSTLYLHLTKGQKRSGIVYPFETETTGIWCEGVRVFRGEDAGGNVVLPESGRFDVRVVSVAALRNPELDESGKGFARREDELITKNKMRQILRIAKNRGVTHLVLGALGCGAFHNPPEAVVEFWRETLSENDVRQAFDEVCFAVIDRSGSGNLPTFKRAFEGFGGR